MIYKISTRDLTNKEFFQFLSLIIGIADNADVVKSKIKTERDALNALMPDLQTSLAVEAANEETLQLVALDKRRDTAISGLLSYVKSLLKNPTAAKRDNALILFNYLKAFGNDIAGENLAEETTSLSTIAKDCTTKSELIAAVAAIDATDWITEISSANTAFINLYKTRTTSISENKKVKSFTSQRASARKAYDALMEIVFSRYKTAIADNADATSLKTCIDDINSTIEQFKALILATTAAKKTAKVEDNLAK